MAQTILPKYCSLLINSAHSVLGLSHVQIVNILSDKPMFVVDYIEKGNHEYIIYIPFSAQKAILYCIFDKDKICEMSYIVLENLEEVDNYIAYLQYYYDYDHIQNHWLLPDSYLAIRKTENDIIFMFSC